MSGDGAQLFEEGLIANGAPDEAECEAFGRRLPHFKRCVSRFLHALDSIPKWRFSLHSYTTGLLPDVLLHPDLHPSGTDVRVRSGVPLRAVFIYLSSLIFYRVTPYEPSRAWTYGSAKRPPYRHPIAYKALHTDIFFLSHRSPADFRRTSVFMYPTIASGQCRIFPDTTGRKDNTSVVSRRNRTAGWDRSSAADSPTKAPVPKSR